MEEYSLDRLPEGEEAILVDIREDLPIRRRLEELGFLPGEPIRLRMRSVSGDPAAYEIGGTVVALRRADSRKITVTGGGRGRLP